jgi:hypothetical protein
MGSDVESTVSYNVDGRMSLWATKWLVALTHRNDDRQRPFDRASNSSPRWLNFSNLGWCDSWDRLELREC